MGSRVDRKDELTVLVTGFGPFRDQHPINPSWEIAKGLPEYLPPLRAKDPSSRNHDAPRNVDIPEVRILTQPEPIRVNYKTVRELVPGLWDEPQEEGRNADVVIHIGMAHAQPIYLIERRAHRTGYTHPDVDGETLADEEEGNRGSDWIWYGLPDEIETELDMPDVLRRWQGYSPDDADLRISDDPGRFLCDFIYYSSLAHLWKQQRPRKVVFLHVPSTASDKVITQGRDLVLNLVRSVAESEMAERARQKTRGVEAKMPGAGDS